MGKVRVVVHARYIKLVGARAHYWLFFSGSSGWSNFGYEDVTDFDSWFVGQGAEEVSGIPLFDWLYDL